MANVQRALRYARRVLRSGRSAALALLVLGVVVGIAVPLAACARDSQNPLVETAIRAGYAMGHLVCHQRSDRSFYSCGWKWPVCGRCAGIYMGAAFGGIIGLATIGRGTRTRPAADRAWRLGLVIAALPTALLWLLEFGAGENLGTFGTLIRWAGALPLGVTAALWLAAIARGELT